MTHKRDEIAAHQNHLGTVERGGEGAPKIFGQDLNSVNSYRSLLRLGDFTDEEMLQLVKLAEELKARRRAGVRGDLLYRRHIALIFEKSSTRTRNSASIAVRDEGGDAEFLTKNDIHLGGKESVKDTARVLGRMFDGILFRGFAQSTVEQLARWSGVPVWNGLTDECHPTQILADLLTIREHVGAVKDIKLVYMGDARYNMGNSLMVDCAKLGMHFVACAPEKYQPGAELISACQEIAQETGAILEFEPDVDKAVAGAHVIYTDVWVSMGEPDAVWEERIQDLLTYRVTADVMKKAGKQCVFMHCLPSFHDLNTSIGKSIYEKFGIDCMEVTDEVFEGPSSIVFDEAENRMHTIKAVMAATLN